MFWLCTIQAIMGIVLICFTAILLAISLADAAGSSLWTQWFYKYADDESPDTSEKDVSIDVRLPGEAFQLNKYVFYTDCSIEWYVCFETMRRKQANASFGQSTSHQSWTHRVATDNWKLQRYVQVAQKSFVHLLRHLFCLYRLCI